MGEHAYMSVSVEYKLVWYFGKNLSKKNSNFSFQKVSLPQLSRSSASRQPCQPFQVCLSHRAQPHSRASVAGAAHSLGLTGMASTHRLKSNESFQLCSFPRGVSLGPRVQSGSVNFSFHIVSLPPAIFHSSWIPGHF